jgi:D-alanyl-D-alanine carboxypeptidase (penicillin-binding protein 5/6)
LDTKIKIIRTLPYAILGILILCAAVCSPLFVTSKFGNPKALAQTPQVLGESVIANGLIRGVQPTAAKQISETTTADASNVKAQSFLVFDLQTGQVLLEKNPEQKLAIASLTKLMTGLVAYNNSNLNNSFTISNKDTLNISPSLGLLPGDQVSALDVFNAMLVGSCNDAALALSNFTQNSNGSNFVGLMNQQAKNLGMSNTSFANPLGFDSSSNYSTADDLKLLITATQKISAFTDLGRRTSYSFTGSLQKNYFAQATNTLIKNHADIQAIKTGFTTEANGAMATKVNLGSDQIVILVLDSQDREEDTLKLKNLLKQDFSTESNYFRGSYKRSP